MQVVDFNKENSWVSWLTPVMQGLFCLLLGIVGVLGAKLLAAESFYSFLFAFVAIVFFTLVNSIVSIFNESFVKYTLPSWGVFLGLTVLLLLFAKLMSGESIQQHAEFIKMLISVAVFYFMLSGMMRVIRAMWEFAEQDEN